MLCRFDSSTSGVRSISFCSASIDSFKLSSCRLAFSKAVGSNIRIEEIDVLTGVVCPSLATPPFLMWIGLVASPSLPITTIADRQVLSSCIPSRVLATALLRPYTRVLLSAVTEYPATTLTRTGWPLISPILMSEVANPWSLVKLKSPSSTTFSSSSATSSVKMSLNILLITLAPRFSPALLFVDANFALFATDWLYAPLFGLPSSLNSCNSPWPETNASSNSITHEGAS